MDLTNKKAFELYSYMTTLHETGKLGFYIAKNMRLIRNEIIEYIDIREAMVRKHGVPEAGGYRIPPEKIASFIESMKPYDDIECSFIPVKVDGDLFISGTLDSNDMFNLDWMVKGGE